MNKYKIPEIAKWKIIPNEQPFFAHPHPTIEGIKIAFKKVVEENQTKLDFDIYTIWKNKLKK